MKTYNQFLETPFSEEASQASPPVEQNKQDPGLVSKQKRANQIKKQVLMKKLQAVRAGGQDIVAGHEPEGENLNELSKSTLASYIKDGSRDAVNRMGDASRAGMSGRRKEADKGYEKANKRLSGVRTAATKLQYKKEEVELDERLGGKGYSKQAAASSVYPGKKGTGDWENSDRGKGNKWKRRAGEKVKAKSPTYLAHVHNKKKKVSEEKISAFELVKRQIEKDVGKSGYVSKDNPRKPQTAAQKKAYAAHKAKLAKQDHRDPTEKASDGRYSDRHSNRGSD